MKLHEAVSIAIDALSEAISQYESVEPLMNKEDKVTLALIRHAHQKLQDFYNDIGPRKETV